MDKSIEKAFKLFDDGKRPWRLVKRDWYVANSHGDLYPLKYIWALAINAAPKSFNTSEAKNEFISKDYSIININILQSDDVIKSGKKYPKTPTKKLSLTTVYERNPKVVKGALTRAKGKCESCKKDAPFKREKDNTPYLEVHHIKQLAQGGEDIIKNTIALCPNCHRQAHFGANNG